MNPFNIVPDEIIRLVYSYIQIPLQLKFLNKRFCQILTKEESLYFADYDTYTTIYPDDFKNFKNLNSLKFIISHRDEYIYSLPDRYPPNITRIDCFGNVLSINLILPISLLYLNCGNNIIRKLPDNLHNLTQLYCHGNELETLPDNLHNLTHLNCQHNFIRFLPDCLNNLVELVCHDNILMALPGNLNSLVFLNCSENNLLEIPDNMNKLKYIDYRDNGFIDVPEKYKKIKNHLFQIADMQ